MGRRLVIAMLASGGLLVSAQLAGDESKAPRGAKAKDRGPAAKPGAPGVTVVMEDCEASRAGRLTAASFPSDFKPEEVRKDPEAFRRRLLEAMQPEKLVKKGRLQTGGDSVDVYLPAAKEGYTVINQGKDDSHHENASTLISIDADRDGTLTEGENWFANLPVRIGDSMWEVKSIAADGSRMEIAPSRQALCGVVVGRKCPPFSFPAVSGKRIGHDTYAGKALLIDIWSVT